MNLKNLLGKAAGLARQHSDKLPKQVRPGVDAVSGMLREDDADAPGQRAAKSKSKPRPKPPSKGPAERKAR